MAKKRSEETLSPSFDKKVIRYTIEYEVEAGEGNINDALDFLRGDGAAEVVDASAIPKSQSRLKNS